MTDSGNPFFRDSPHPLGYPPFDQIRNEHFLPAFERGMAEQLEEVRAVAAADEPPTFENTLVALERSGRLLGRVRPVFFNLTSAHTNDELEKVRSVLAPKLARHSDAILLDADLFRRIEALHDALAELELDDEGRRLVERYHTMFVRAGARLPEDDKERLRGLNSELAELQTTFSQNVLNEVNASYALLDSADELAGFSPGEIESAAEAAVERGHEGKYAIPLMNTTGQPALASLENRKLRRRIMETSMARNSRGGEHDNLEIVSRTLRLRAERARLLGYGSHAAYVLDDQMALTPEAVDERLAELTPPAVRNARREAERLQEMIESEGCDFELRVWDWAFYREKVREAEYAFDESTVKQYFEMWKVLEDGVFFAANRLFGITFERTTELPTYHPDVRVYEVRDEDGEHFAYFLADFWSRPSKRGGAWMNGYVKQSGLFGDKPVVGNHMNVTKPPAGQPTLLTFSEVRTLFHEFGHALHGLLSDVTYPFFSGTSVPRDFVEFPSQVFEMWGTWPEVLERCALHHETGEPLPEELVEKVLALRTFDQGYKTTEYLAASLIDQAFHRLPPEDVPEPGDVLAFEAEALRQGGAALEEVPPRYRMPYFTHVFIGYDAGYYSYIWAEVLDADAVEWFEERGGLTRENGEHYRKHVLSRGGSVDPMELYRRFRGRDARIEPLLVRRGLVER